MNGLTLLCGLTLLGSTPVEEKLDNSTEIQTNKVLISVSQERSVANFETSEVALWSKAVASDPHTNCKENANLDLNEIVFIEKEPQIELGFDTADYLPKNFDPYANPSDFEAISYIDAQDQIALGFDTADYLPEGFDPYTVYFDLNAVEYIDELEEFRLDFDTADYLPENFDPYAYPSDIEGINYIEEEEQIALGFDTADYLPEGFDPYVINKVTEEVTVTAL